MVKVLTSFRQPDLAAMANLYLDSASGHALDLAVANGNRDMLDRVERFDAVIIEGNLQEVRELRGRILEKNPNIHILVFTGSDVIEQREMSALLDNKEVKANGLTNVFGKAGTEDSMGTFFRMSDMLVNKAGISTWAMGQ